MLLKVGAVCISCQQAGVYQQQVDACGLAADGTELELAREAHVLLKVGTAWISFSRGVCISSR